MIQFDRWKLTGVSTNRDIYEITQHEHLRIKTLSAAAEFLPVKKWEIDRNYLCNFDPETGEVEIDKETGEPKVDQEKLIPYVHKFIVEYINSDLLVIFYDCTYIFPLSNLYGRVSFLVNISF